MRVQTSEGALFLPSDVGALAMEPRLTLKAGADACP